MRCSSRCGDAKASPTSRSRWPSSSVSAHARDFYDRTGALRDMIQNHALQLLTMIAMEPPSRNDADAIRNEKLKVLEALKAVHRGERAARRRARAVSPRDGRWQAGAGLPRRAGVPPDSRTETFVALRCEVQNWRWAGVPFYFRTGKRVGASEAHIVVNFRPAPHSIFPGSNTPNKLVIKLQPEDGLELHLLAAKGSGRSEALSPVFLDLDFDKAFAENRVGAYERLLLEAIAGRLKPVRAQRRAGTGVAMGRADLASLGARRRRLRRPASLSRRHLGPGCRERAGCARRLHVARRTVTSNATNRRNDDVDDERRRLATPLSRRKRDTPGTPPGVADPPAHLPGGRRVQGVGR
jgi:hypothetical protein